MDRGVVTPVQSRRVCVLGVEDGARVALLCSTRVEWLFIDLAINTAGAATTTIYPSSTSADAQYIAHDSGSAIVFAENDDSCQIPRTTRQPPSRDACGQYRRPRFRRWMGNPHGRRLCQGEARIAEEEMT